jgi:hypothetical protein
MKKIIRLTESDLVRIVRKLIHEQPGKIIGQKLVRPVLNLVRGQGGKQISKTAKLSQEIVYLQNVEQKFKKEEQLLITKLLNKEINHQQFSSEAVKLSRKYNIDKVRDGIFKRRKQINIEKNRKIVANTPQENIIKSRYEAMRGKNISQGGSNNLGVFDLENGYIAKVSNKAGWADQGIGNLKLKDKIKSPRVMKTVEVKSFIDSKGKEIVYQIQQKATGKPMDRLTKAEIEQIPKEHLTNFKKDLEELYRNNVYVDPSKRSNFIYDPSKGIQFIDLGGIRKYKQTSAEEILDVLLQKW